MTILEGVKAVRAECTGDQLVGGPGVEPGFAASDAAVLIRLHYPPLYDHPWSSRRESNPDFMTGQTRLGPKRHDALDHASLLRPRIFSATSAAFLRALCG